MSSLIETLRFQYACWKFRSQRGEFYTDLSRTMDMAKGRNLRDTLRVLAGRHKGHAKGVLCNYWLNRLETEVSTFSEALTGSVPYEDQILLQVCEEAGDLAFGMRALGKNLEALKGTIKNIQYISTVALLMVVFLIGYFFAEAYYILPDMFKNIASSIDIHKLGDMTDSLLTFVDVWQGYAHIICGGVVALIVGMMFSLKRYIGGARPFLDKYFLPYQLYRAFNGALFMSTLSVITQKIGGNRVVALRSALEKINGSAYPWLKWQTQKIIDNLEGEQGGAGEIFNTGIMDQRAYFRVLDMSDYTTDTAVLMANVAEIVLEETPIETEKKVQRWNMLLRTLVIGLMLSFFVATSGVNSEFSSALEMANVG